MLLPEYRATYVVVSGILLQLIVDSGVCSFLTHCVVLVLREREKEIYLGDIMNKNSPLTTIFRLIQIMD